MSFLVFLCLRSHSAQRHTGAVTDVKIVHNAEGKSRQFGFVGFADVESADRAKKNFDATFIDTSKISVETAHGIGDESLQRPWSKYSEGSSRFKGKDPQENTFDQKVPAKKSGAPKSRRSAEEIERERDEKFAEFLKVAMPKKKQKKGEASNSMPWANIEETPDDIQGKTNELDAMDDMAWLRGKQGLAEDARAEEKKEEAEEQERRGRSDADKIAETRRLFIRNLPLAADESAVRERCEEFGQVIDLVLPVNQNSKTPKGFALVTFAEPQQALLAYSALDGYAFQGRLLHVVAGEAPAGVR